MDDTYRRRKPRRRTLTGWALACLIVTGLALALREQDWSATRSMLTPGALPLLLLSCVINVAALLCAMMSWRSILADLGHLLPRRTAAGIYFVGMSAKYAPGAIWVALTQARLARTVGVGTLVTVAVSLLNIPVVLLTGMVVGSLAAPLLFGAWSWLLLLPAAALAFVLARPSLVGRAAQAAARLLRRELTASGTGHRIRAAIGWQLACRLISGLHLWLLTLLMGAPIAESLVISIGAFALATGISSVVVVLPDGALIRETVLIGTLSQVLPIPEATAVAVASRAVCLFTDLLTGAVCAPAMASRLRRRETMTEHDRSAAF
ncbi:hypothetical protein SRB5_00780 [Streptomyces sp. RB5]|uniref:Uncharacterized protein n=1 Tax=Streptomyces smaragdinus TaxID=2585196 RepID=A0A7K0CB18_9ACTN|nr:lysylphosphatidylglycerol synthase domain-containing protein [Streptomyces smaragdinus]MQY09974.1 hypothetical protein [Streptomyces smaragdinus]